jgi:hypothetical protein
VTAGEVEKNAAIKLKNVPTMVRADMPCRCDWAFKGLANLVSTANAWPPSVNVVEFIMTHPQIDLKKLEQHVPEFTAIHVPISTPTRKLTARTPKPSCCSTFKKVDPTWLNKASRLFQRQK